MSQATQVRFRSLWMGKGPLRILGNILLLIPILAVIFLVGVFPGEWLEDDPELRPWIMPVTFLIILVAVGLAFWL